MRDDAARALLVDEDLPTLDSAATRQSRQRPRRFERTGSHETYGSLALQDRPEPATRPAPRSPARAYGTHRRGEAAPVVGYQAGRRTVEISGQVQQPRRRSQTTSAFVANPDRTALWAFLLAVFLVLMAVATANAGV